MNNFRKSLKELFQVNHEAGLLRLFLAAILTFILWSLLAAFSAAFKPLGSLNLSNKLGFNSQNLALSLFFDIINSYFSTFTILLLILFVLVAFLSFDSIADFYSTLRSLPSNRTGKNHLSSCAFSFPKRKKFLFPDDFINSSGINPDGPLEAVIKPGYALLISSGADHSIKFNNADNSDNIDVSIAFREKIIDCFKLDPASFSFTIEDQTSAKSFYIEVAYSYDLPPDNDNMAKFANMLSLCDSKIIREIIENILISETKIALSQFFRNSSGFSALTLGQVPEKLIYKNENKTNESDQKKHTMIFNLYKKVQDPGIKRNRKRPVYLSPASEVTSISNDHEENLSPTLKDSLNEMFAINLQSTLLALFGANCIKAKIINIHEQGSNE